MNRLKELRKESSYTQEAIAAKLGTAQENISNYEIEKVPIPVDLLIQFAQLYHTSTDYILGLSSERQIVKFDADQWEQDVAKLSELYERIPKSKRKVILDLLICFNQ